MAGRRIVLRGSSAHRITDTGSQREGVQSATADGIEAADLIGREMDFECRCGRRWRLEHYFGEDGSLLGPSWILL
jgi:hypothetical protein